MAHAKTRVEILADAAYPPYSWQEGEEVSGFDPIDPDTFSRLGL